MSESDLVSQLTRNPHRFQIFQAVRMLERAAGSKVGEDEAPREEAVRFGVVSSLSFPPSEIVAFVPPQNDQPPRMTVSFLGLVGPMGVLPRHYTQLVIDRIRLKDYSLRDFLDLFHHRLISLFYRAWRKYRFSIGYERAAAQNAPGTDDFTQVLKSLVGWGTPGLHQRMLLDDETWLYYAGLFSHAPRTATALAGLVADYFGIPVEIRQFVGQWLQIRREDQSSLPGPRTLGSANNALGVNTVAGDRVWSIEQKFRLRLGPLSYAEFNRFIPGGDRLAQAAQLVRSYVGPEFDFDFQLILRPEEVPYCQLGGPAPTRLGWNGWLISTSLDREADDAIFSHDGQASR